MSKITPLQHNEREIFMDVLRGFAIFGILIANLTAGGLGWGPNRVETGPFITSELDHQLSFVYSMFIDGKFYSIFSMLFGWGIALQLQRGTNRGIDATPTVRRRLGFMLLLGSFHILIWNGDIVLFYAMLGFLLLPFRKFSNKTLLITGACLILSPIILYALKLHWPVLNSPAVFLQDAGNKVSQYLLGISTDADYNAWINKASWWDMWVGNMGGVFYRFSYLVFISRIPKVFGMFLIGFVIGRSGFYKNIAQNRNTILKIIGVGLLIGLPANYLLAYYSENFVSDYYNLKPNGLYQTIAYAFGVAPLALVYAGTLMLCFQTIAGKKIMSIIAPVGKMAFSNYIMHSLVCQFVFLPQGLGYGGQVGQYYLSLFGITLYLSQIVISTLWLKYFNYGPFEWLWRSLTYWKRQTMIK
ncbi:MAG: DUF418 domain-containing protein [Saprospiraceae bacterium]